MLFLSNSWVNFSVIDLNWKKSQRRQLKRIFCSINLFSECGQKTRASRSSVHVEIRVKKSRTRRIWWWWRCDWFGASRTKAKHLLLLITLSYHVSKCCYFSVFCAVREKRWKLVFLSNSINFNFFRFSLHQWKQNRQRKIDWSRKIDENWKFFCPFSNLGKTRFSVFLSISRRTFPRNTNLSNLELKLELHWLWKLNAKRNIWAGKMSFFHFPIALSLFSF